MRVLLILLAVTLVAVWIGYKELATGLVLVAGLLIYKTRPATISVEEPVYEPMAGYPLLILTAMDWKASGKDYYLPEGEDKANPQLLYVGHKIKGGLDGKPTFLPELEVFTDHIDAIRYLD